MILFAQYSPYHGNLSSVVRILQKIGKGHIGHRPQKEFNQNKQIVQKQQSEMSIDNNFQTFEAQYEDIFNIFNFQVDDQQRSFNQVEDEIFIEQYDHDCPIKQSPTNCSLEDKNSEMSSVREQEDSVNLFKRSQLQQQALSQKPHQKIRPKHNRVCQQIKRAGSKKVFRNWLIALKKCLIPLLKNESILADEFLTKFINNPKNTSRQEFEELFRNQNSKLLLCQVFLSKRLNRDLVTSRVSNSNKAKFIRNLSLMKKAFIYGRLPHL